MPDHHSSAGTVSKSCPHDMGFDRELGPVGCRLVGLELECVCERINAVPQAAAETEIGNAVRRVLATNKWPINRDYDDAGLSERNYIVFVGEVLASLALSRPE